MNKLFSLAHTQRWAITVPLTLVLAAGTWLSVAAQAPFGSEDEQSYGDALWAALEDKNFLGEDAIMAKPYTGTDPHGTILVTLVGEVEVNGDRGTVIVKHNYAGDDATVDSVATNPRDYLDSTTVMFERAGYSPENHDWFWAKYLPDGSYDTAPNGAALVGSPTGCVTCHQDAPGDDMVFLNDGY